MAVPPEDTLGEQRDDTIEQAKRCGPGGWHSAAILRGYELLGRYLGMFHEKIDFSGDEKIIALLAAGRKRAAGIADDEELPEDQRKPN